MDLDSRIEVERAQGGYWLPTAFAAALGTAGGLAALRGHRGIGAVLGAIGAAGIWGDFTMANRFLRAPLPKRETYNVVAELGPKAASRTVVFMAHHDAAHSGFFFNPAIIEAVDRRAPQLIEKSNTSPPIIWPIFGGPAAVALGSLLGSRALVKAGIVVNAGVMAFMADIASRDVVPGANDNASGVAALFGIAREYLANPPEDMRAIFLSCGSEESFEEGSYAFGRRHFGSLPKDSTAFICIDGVGSPHLARLEGEGMLQMYEYPQDAKEIVDEVGAELGIELWPGLRLRNATDGLVPLRAGYKTVSIAACTKLKQPVNYHWPTDTPDCVTYETIHDAVRLAAAAAPRIAAAL